MYVLKQYKGFFGSCDVSVENNTFYGEIEDIYDLICYEAATQQELQRAFEDAVDGYLQSCKLRGKDR